MVPWTTTSRDAETNVPLREKFVPATRSTVAGLGAATLDGTMVRTAGKTCTSARATRAIPSDEAVKVNGMRPVTVGDTATVTFCTPGTPIVKDAGVTVTPLGAATVTVTSAANRCAAGNTGAVTETVNVRVSPALIVTLEGVTVMAKSGLGTWNERRFVSMRAPLLTEIVTGMVYMPGGAFCATEIVKVSGGKMRATGELTLPGPLRADVCCGGATVTPGGAARVNVNELIAGSTTVKAKTTVADVPAEISEGAWT